MKIDKRKNYYITIDTETTQGWGKGGKFYSPLVYDIGYAIHDKKGRIYETGNYVIKNIFYSRAMKTAFYGIKFHGIKSKLPQKKFLLFLLQKQSMKLIKLAKNMVNSLFWLTMLTLILELLQKRQNIPELKQYDGTLESIFYMVKKIEVRDIWGLFVETIGVRKSYKRFTDTHGLVSEKGNRKTSAEVAHKYLTQNPNFIEDHTALSDVLIEVFIFTQAMRQKKKHSKKYSDNLGG